MALVPDSSYEANGLTVYEYLLTKHNPNKIDMPTVKMPATPLGITVHNTDWIAVASSTTPAEQYTRATVNGNMKTVRVHFYVDDICAWQNLPLDLSGWHAADGSGNGNRKTISIECIMKGSNGDAISKKAEENCAKLVAYLLDKYNLNVEDNVFTHTHWLNVKAGRTGTNEYLNTTKLSGQKYCPAYILPHWATFKKSVNDLMNKTDEKIATPETPVVAQLYRVRKSWEEPKTQLGAYNSLNNATAACKEGYSVYDKDGKCVYTKTATSTSAPAQTPTSSESNDKPSVKYRVYSGGTWRGEITNWNSTNGNGYAGVENSAVRGLTAYTTTGTLKYRVHSKGGGWLSWISKSDVNDWNKGVAGLKSRDIDGIQFDFSGVTGYTVKYRCSVVGSTSYLSWITGWGDGSMGYSGIFGKSIDKIQVEIVKK